MHRRLLLRSLALAGLGVAAGACGSRDDRATTDGGGERARDADRERDREDGSRDPGSPGDADRRGTDGADRRGTDGADQRATDGADQRAADGDSDPDPGDAPSSDVDPGEADPGDLEEPDAPDDEDQADEPDEPTAARVEVLCREAVGLRPATPTDAHHRLDRLTLHHTAVPLDAAAQAPERLRRHQRHHQDQGWSDIAYHYAVDLAGNVYELRDPAVPGDTFTDYDTIGHLHVVCEGNFEQQQPTDALLDALGGLFAALAATHRLDPASLDTHRRYVPTTACPGGHLQARLDEVRARVGALMRQPPALEVRCGEQARRRVHEIEAN